ncbi:MAG: rod shape-determining protein MreD [Candidatus Nealsonbacteria bacterium]
MVKKIIFLFFFFYFLTLLQTSFLARFFSFLPNLVLITIILINLFEGQKDNLGIFAALGGGFFLDIFSEKFLGYYILISLSISLFIKLILKRYIGRY